MFKSSKQCAKGIVVHLNSLQSENHHKAAPTPTQIHEPFALQQAPTRSAPSTHRRSVNDEIDIRPTKKEQKFILQPARSILIQVTRTCLSDIWRLFLTLFFCPFFFCFFPQYCHFTTPENLYRSRLYDLLSAGAHISILHPFYSDPPKNSIIFHFET